MVKYLYIDQYGNKYYTSSRKHLIQAYQLVGKVSIMYNTIKGIDYAVGYVIGNLWLTRYKLDAKEV